MGHQLEPGYISIWVLKTRIEGERLRVVAAAWLALGGNPVRMSALHVRRDKAARSSGTRPTRRFAPAGSNRGRHGGDEMSEAPG
jgi:hypothetical protein